ncbi:hypothetical protein L7F22_031383 [Adiantum nelumboides]|nr:hypothetical protein [Adiantum nelumboides]
MKKKGEKLFAISKGKQVVGMQEFVFDSMTHTRSMKVAMEKLLQSWQQEEPVEVEGDDSDSESYQGSFDTAVAAFDPNEEETKVWLKRVGLYEFACLPWQSWAENEFAEQQWLMLKENKGVIVGNVHLTPKFVSKVFKLLYLSVPAKGIKVPDSEMKGEFGNLIGTKSYYMLRNTGGIRAANLFWYLKKICILQKTAYMLKEASAPLYHAEQGVKESVKRENEALKAENERLIADLQEMRTNRKEIEDSLSKLKAKISSGFLESDHNLAVEAELEAKKRADLDFLVEKAVEPVAEGDIVDHFCNDKRMPSFYVLAIIDVFVALCLIEMWMLSSPYGNEILPKGKVIPVSDRERVQEKKESKPQQFEESADDELEAGEKKKVLQPLDIEEKKELKEEPDIEKPVADVQVDHEEVKETGEESTQEEQKVTNLEESGGANFEIQVETKEVPNNNWEMQAKESQEEKEKVEGEERNPDEQVGSEEEPWKEGILMDYPDDQEEMESTHPDLQNRVKVKEDPANIVLLVIMLATIGYASLWGAVLVDVGTCVLVIFNSMLLLERKKDESRCLGLFAFRRKRKSNVCQKDVLLSSEKYVDLEAEPWCPKKMEDNRVSTHGTKEENEYCLSYSATKSCCDVRGANNGMR